MTVPTSPTSVEDEVVEELCSAAFAGLRRRDQRRRGEQYVRGLLSSTGRRSIRNIATSVGGAAAAQNLHHFVHSSTWDWNAVRELLLSHLRERITPAAWVVSPLSIPKNGDHSVGVLSCANKQQAFGLWLTDESSAFPVDWRLYLTTEWLADRNRRSRAAIPSGAGAETLGQSVANVAFEAARRWGPLDAPVVFDNDSVDLDLFGTGLAAAPFPFLMRVRADNRFVVTDPTLPGYGSVPTTARRLLEAVRGLRGDVEWTDPVTRRRHTSAAVTVPVEPIPRRPDGGPDTGKRRMLRLVGEWSDPRNPPERMWLTNARTPSVDALLRSGKLPRRVARDSEEIGGTVGIRDFEGRTYPGWHRHITLASLAHTARVLSRDRTADY
ncbi:SRSO17 transposase [Actinopolyspora alba]|uniref:SRSO17 transposase n=1 Tax=Actinopolyspora alba TaxID=673379 RepID=A0A1I2BPB8_9ACTN|nr:transposase [Actinopolyspora alba]SFE57982.1 SRSO17 transposase [Actinopolyspora alba]